MGEDDALSRNLSFSRSPIFGPADRQQITSPTPPIRSCRENELPSGKMVDGVSVEAFSGSIGSIVHP